MPYRLYIFDLDDTLTVSANAGVGSPIVRWMPGRAERLKQLSAQGAYLAIATNQGGVGLGDNTEADIRAAIDRVAGVVTPPMTVFAAFGHPRATVPGYPRDDPMRKPRPGMILAAMRHFGVTAAETVYVGDRSVDRETARAAGVDYQDTRDFFAPVQRSARTIP